MNWLGNPQVSTFKDRWSWELEMLTFCRVEEGMERALAPFGDQKTVDVKSFCEELRKELEILQREFERKTRGSDFVSRQ
jgi:hypothetical protein